MSIVQGHRSALSALLHTCCYVRKGALPLSSALTEFNFLSLQYAQIIYLFIFYQILLNIEFKIYP